MDSTQNIASSTSAADSALPVAEDSKNAGEGEKSQVEAASENRNNGKEGENGSNISEKKDRSESDVVDGESEHRTSINTALVAAVDREYASSSGSGGLDEAGIRSAKTVENRSGECSEELGREDPRTIYKQQAYHPRCFTCFECKSEKLSGLNGFYVNGRRRYCVDCYNMHVAERCTNCNEAILEGGVRHRSRPFHHKCFKCAGCDAVLGKTPFVWRDQRTLCLPCYAEKFAEKCVKCSATIQPGEQYLQVEGKHFHDQCLVCDICQDQLLDNPFVQDGERNVCVNCSTNGFSSYKLKDSPATAENPATTEESPSPAPARESHRDSSGMDIKDWISKPNESNKNSADLSPTPNQPTNVAVPVAEAAEVAAEAVVEAAPEPVVEAAPEPEVEADPEPEAEAAPEPVEDTTSDNAESEEADDGN